MSEIRGLMINSRIDYLESLPDSTVYQKVMQRLPESVRQNIGEQIFLTNLYPFQVLKELDAAMAEVLDSSIESLFRSMGKRSATRAVDQYFFNYMQSRNPHGFLSQITRLYPYLCNFGEYFYQKSDQTSARIRLSYNEDIHKPYCWFVQSFLQNGIEICGGKKVVLQEVECEADAGESCRYEVQWEI